MHTHHTSHKADNFTHHTKQIITIISEFNERQKYQQLFIRIIIGINL